MKKNFFKKISSVGKWQMLMREEVGESQKKILLPLLNRFFNKWMLVLYSLLQVIPCDLEVTVFSKTEVMFSSLFLGTRIM